MIASLLGRLPEGHKANRSKSVRYRSRGPCTTYATVSYGYVSVFARPMTSVMRIAVLTGTSSHRGTVMTATTDVSVASAEQEQPVRRPGPLPEFDPEPRTTTQRLAVGLF